MAIERVSVHSMEEAEGLPGDPATAVVSVTDPQVEARLAPGFASVLRLAFHDVEEDLPGEMPGLLGWPERIQPFAPDQARELVSWARDIDAEPEAYHVAVHCHAGISRSSAIGLFLHRCYDAEMKWYPHFHPNRLVLRLLAECSETGPLLPDR